MMDDDVSEERMTPRQVTRRWPLPKSGFADWRSRWRFCKSNSGWSMLKLVRAPGLRLRYRSDRRKGRIVRALPSTKPCKACQLTIRPHQTGMVPLLWRKRISFDKKRII